MENRILLTSIQRFSLYDGPGIRTTVFLKGCNLRCPWCSNPENLLPTPQPYMRNGMEETYGKYYTPEALTRECLKDKTFYKGKTNTWDIKTADEIDLLPGGVTFSGGECLLQMDVLIPVCENLHKSGIHIVVETCLFVPTENVRTAINHIDFFYVDVKILDAVKCKESEKGNLNLYLKNLDILMQSDRPVVVRIPVIGNYTDGMENRTAVKQLMCKYAGKILKIELIKEHNLGESKYKSLNTQMDYHGVEDSVIKLYKAELSNLGIQVEICKI